VKNTILDKSKKTNRICYLIMLLLCLAVVIMWPLWGDQTELFLCTQWSQIPSKIYFVTYSVLYCRNFQLPFIMFYIILQLQVQIIILNEQILQIENKFSHLEDLDKTSCVLYQKKINECLQLVTEQHCAIIRYESINSYENQMCAYLFSSHFLP
jgi:hypothetical protein